MKIDLVFLIVLGIVVAYIFMLYKVETMADTGTTDQIKEAVKQIYLADVEAIRNLSEVATKLQASGLTIPGQLTTNIINASDNINVSNKTNEGGRVRILNELKNGKADQTNDWSIYNMTGDYGNKLSFWRYNGDGKNAGSALDIFDNGTVSVANNVVLNKNGVTISKGDGSGELNVQGDIKVGKWIISDRGDGLGFYFGDKNNLKYFMWPNGTNLWQSNNQLQSAGDYITNGSKIGITNWQNIKKRLQIDNDEFPTGDRAAKFSWAGRSADNPWDFGSWESMRILRL